MKIVSWPIKVTLTGESVTTPVDPAYLDRAEVKFRLYGHTPREWFGIDDLVHRQWRLFHEVEGAPNPGDHLYLGCSRCELQYCITCNPLVLCTGA